MNDNININVGLQDPDLVNIDSETPVVSIDVNIVEEVDEVNIKVIEKLTDGLKLDDLQPPDDNTDLNASTLNHGLMPKLDGNGSHYLAGDGTWRSPSISAADVAESATKRFVTDTEKKIWDHIIVYVDNAADEDIAFANGAKIVVRTDLI